MNSKEKQAQLARVRDVVDTIGGKWRVAILVSLQEENKRFNELKKDLGNVTSRILSKELQSLEMNQLVQRRSCAVNLHTVYGLTGHGRSVVPLIGMIAVWGQRHRDEIFRKVDTNFQNLAYEK